MADRRSWLAVAGPTVAIAVVLASTSAGAQAPPRDASTSASDSDPDPAPAAYDLAYDALVARPPAHHARTIVGELGFLAAGTIWYWLDRERQVADWDYPSLGERLSFEAWRLDHNPFGINWIWHPIDGAGFHALARANHQSLAAAALYGFGTSLAWEYLLEFREKISVNDVVVTPGAGVTFGEFFHWLGVYLGSAPRRGAGHTAARWLLSPFHALDRALDDGAPPPPGPDGYDALGLSRDIAHRFDLDLRLARARPAGAAAGDDVDVAAIAVSGRLAALPGYLRPVRLRRTFADGNLTRLDARLASSGDGASFALAGDTLLVGRHVQDPTPDGGVRAATIAVSLAYAYRRDRFGGFRDRVGLLHLPGLALDGHVVSAGGVRLSAALRARADLGGLHALAYPAYLAANPGAIEKEILRKQGYYYAWGGSLRLDLELALPRLVLGATGFAGRYASIDGLDRNQELIDDDVAAADTLVDLEIFARVAPLAGPLRLELRATHARRDSTVGAFDAAARLTTLGASVGATF